MSVLYQGGDASLKLKNINWGISALELEELLVPLEELELEELLELELLEILELELLEDNRKLLIFVNPIHFISSLKSCISKSHSIEFLLVAIIIWLPLPFLI